MKIELDAVDALPEHIRGLAVQEGEKFALDLSQLAPADELNKYKSKALTAEQEAIERRKALKAWGELGQTPDEVREKLSKGADPEIVAQLRKAAEDTKAEYSAKLTKMLSDRTMAEFKAELAKVGVVPEGLDLMASYARQMIQFDDDGAVRIVQADGKPMIGGGANGGATLSDLAASLAKAMPRLVADNGAGGGGKPPASGGKPNSGTIKASELEAMTPQQKAKFFRDNPGIAVV